MRRPTHAKTATPQQSPPPTQPPCQEFWSRSERQTFAGLEHDCSATKSKALLLHLLTH